MRRINIAKAWEEKTMIEGIDFNERYTQSIDDDQVFSTQQGIETYDVPMYDEYNIYVNDKKYTYTSKEMKKFAKSW